MKAIFEKNKILVFTYATMDRNKPGRPRHLCGICAALKQCRRNWADVVQNNGVWMFCVCWEGIQTAIKCPARL